jgi:membrane associated rhomboid family serine protease
VRTELRISSERRQAEDWALALAAEGVAAEVRRTEAGFALRVPAAEAERADAILVAYESENPPEPAPEKVAVSSHAALNGALAAVGALLAFFLLVTGPRDPGVAWFARGSADAERILAGEHWRAVTALTLHADFEHVLANAIAGLFFFTAVGRAMGPGLGLAAVLLSGAGGNLANALFHGASHVSVGASTSVFGALGLLGGLGVARQRRRGSRGHRQWTPFAAGLALLAMLGTGQRADIWAHLFGLLVGAVLGLGLAVSVHRPSRPVIQWMLGGCALATILYCWGLAMD